MRDHHPAKTGLAGAFARGLGPSPHASERNMKKGNDCLEVASQYKSRYPLSSFTRAHASESPA